jgi:hypothetical protein
LLPSWQELVPASGISDVACARPIGCELNIVTSRRELVECELKVEILLANDKFKPAREQAAHFRRFGERRAYENQSIRRIQIPVLNATAKRLKSDVMPVSKVDC